MNERFRQFTESLHSSFEALMAMSPAAIETLPRGVPDRCIYLLPEGDRRLYVGRTRKFRKRMQQHSRPGAQHNQAVFAFKIAREVTGNTVASYRIDGSRSSLMNDKEVLDAFDVSKKRIRQMSLRFVQGTDATRQALLEMYVAIALETPYNDFDTH